MQLERAVGGAEADQVARDTPALVVAELAAAEREVGGARREGRSAHPVTPDRAGRRAVLEEVDQGAVGGQVALGEVRTAVAAARRRTRGEKQVLCRIGPRGDAQS